MVLFPLKYTCTPNFVAYICKTFTKSLAVGYHQDHVVVVCVGVVVSLLSIPLTMGLGGTEFNVDFGL